MIQDLICFFVPKDKFINTCQGSHVRLFYASVLHINKIYYIDRMMILYHIKYDNYTLHIS